MIRLAEPAEAEQVERLVRDGCRELAEQGHAEADLGELVVDQIHANPDFPVTVAVEGSHVVGAAVWLPHPLYDGVVHGWGTYVHPAFRGRKISRDIREYAADIWRLRGARKVVGTAGCMNKAGCESALKMGFKPRAIELELEL